MSLTGNTPPPIPCLSCPPFFSIQRTAKHMTFQLHRNPTIEEQALARIHRIGQQKEVTTVRFFIKDTFEEVTSNFHLVSKSYNKNRLTVIHRQRILDLQRSKKKLEEVLLDPKKGGEQHSERLAGLEVCSRYDFVVEQIISKRDLVLTSFRICGVFCSLAWPDGISVSPVLSAGSFAEGTDQHQATAP